MAARAAANVSDNGTHGKHDKLKRIKTYHRNLFARFVYVLLTIWIFLQKTGVMLCVLRMWSVNRGEFICRSGGVGASPGITLFVWNTN